MPVTPIPPRGHIVVRHATVLTLDPAIGDIDRGDIEVRDGVIVDVGTALAADGAEVIDASRLIALPGLVDTHWHVWGTVLRGVVGDGKEHGWFARKAQFGPLLTPEDVYAGVRLGLAEGLAAGITTVHDWNHYVLSSEHAEADLQAVRDVGARVHFTAGPPTAAPQLTLEQMRSVLARIGVSVDEATDMQEVARLRDAWTPPSDGLLTVGVNVRGPARSTEPVYRREWAEARALGLPIAMHCAGTKEEVARIHQVEVLSDAGLLGDDMVLAHCLYLTDREQHACADHDVAVSVSPLSELRLAMGMPRITELRSAGICVSLSLDTTAIAGSADLFQAMRVAVGLENARHGDALSLTPRQALRLATIEGARALGLGDVTGSLTPGKRADLILVRADAPNMAPVADPVVAIVHSAQPSNVDTVLVDGQVLKRDGRLTNLDIGEAVDRAAASLLSLRARSD